MTLPTPRHDAGPPAIMSRRRALAAGATLAAASAGCASTAAEDLAGEPLRIFGNLSTLELAPVLLASKSVYRGRNVLEQGGIPGLFGKPGDLPNLVAKGRCDLATNSETQALRVSVQQPDLRFIFTVSEGLYRIVARRSAGITRLADLKGKRVGTMPKTSSAYYLDRMLRTAGLTEADVTTVPYVAGTQRPLTMMPEAMQRGELDAVTIWEPEMQRCVDLLGNDAVLFFDPAVYREQFCLFTTAAHLQNALMRKRIVAYVRALIDASEQIRRRPQTAWPLVEEATRLNPRTIERAWPHQTYPGTLVGDLLDTLADEDVWVARETGRAPRSRAQLAPLIDATVLEEALTR